MGRWNAAEEVAEGTVWARSAALRRPGRHCGHAAACCSCISIATAGPRQNKRKRPRPARHACNVDANTSGLWRGGAGEVCGLARGAALLTEFALFFRHYPNTIT